MPKLPCPECHAPQGQSLADLLYHRDRTYYLCAKCGHMWTVEKDGSGEIKNLKSAALASAHRSDDST